MHSTREPGLWKLGLAWLLLLGPLFFLSYGFATWWTAQRETVGSLVFPWEQQIPLWPWSIVPYWSIDLLYGLSFLLPSSRQEMHRHGLRLLTAQLICVSCFLLWPLRFSFVRPEIDGLFGWLFDVLMGFDKPFNQAPSLHIALLVILWACFARHTHNRWLRVLMHGWMGLIGLSVLTTWQHHFIDLPTGVLVGCLCIWLWPAQGTVPYASARLAKSRKEWRLALSYLMGAWLCAALGWFLWGAWLWLLWPAVALLLVALNYLWLGPAGFQKQANGQLSSASRWLLAPYLLGAWLNSRIWTRKHPQADPVLEGVWLGRVPRASETKPFAAVLDVTAELPVKLPCTYSNLPLLDLLPVDVEACRHGAELIESLRQQGPVLVCCALGYSRSASLVAAWLLHTKRARDVKDAIRQLRKARPQIVLGAAQVEALQALQVSR